MRRYKRLRAALAKTRTDRYAVYVTSLSVLFLFMSVLLLYVFENIQVIRLGYQLKLGNEQLSALTLENDQSRLVLSRLTALERLDALARNRFGLRCPGKDEVILIPHPRAAAGQQSRPKTNR